ncbi:MAG: IS4 family transposase [Deltaproteobacteria bacterium]|nr:IS4 family transposase [Nannocystaceae bacterium]
MSSRSPIDASRVYRFVESLVGEDMHAKRVLSLGNAVVGVMHAASLSIHAIGEGLAASKELVRRHSVKQVDRLLSNSKLNVWELLALWVPYVLGERSEAVIALDWTDYDGDDQCTIAAYLITSHGRATPLVWKTVPKSKLAKKRNEYEDDVLERLRELIPRAVHVTILADRGFGDQKLYGWLLEVGWHFAIRFRECIEVRDAEGESKTAGEWVSKTGRARMLKDVEVTKDRMPIPAVVLVHAKKMKDPWCVATSRADLTATEVTKLYGRRFTIEESFRDTKDIRFGFGLSATHIRDCDRRDRLLFIAAIAEALLKLLGAAGETVGLDRLLKTSTSKKRQLSLLRQGLLWYQFLPGLKEERARPLMEEFDRLVRVQPVFSQAFGIL